jgi:DNA-binding MarR family transcriptional regulator
MEELMARRPSAKRAGLIDELMLEARRTGSLGALHSRAAAALTGINATDWECLDLLDWIGPITAGELARRVGITSGAVTGAIDRLEALGLVERGVDPSDRRKVIVRLVDHGAIGWPPEQRPLLEHFAALGTDVADVNDRFDDDQLAAIADWLRASNDAVERAIERIRAKPRG